MRRFARLLLLPFSAVVFNVARDQWGTTGESVALGMVVLTVGTIGYVDWRRARRIRRAIAALPLEEQIEAIRNDAEVRDAAAGDVFGNERADRTWQVTRFLGPWLGVCYLPGLYLIGAGRNANGLIMMVLAVVGYVTWRWYARRYVSRYQCPRCGKRIPAVSLRPVRYVCVPCAITWRL
jgi:Flp pilus assembly protein TadB